MIEIISNIRTNFVIEITDSLIRPCVPDILQLSIQLVAAFCLRAGKSSTKEKIISE